MSKLIIATTPGCHYCVQAKKLMRQMRIKYTEKKILTEADWDWLEEKMGKEDIGVPQLFLNGKYIGGLEKLQALYKKRRNSPKAKLAAKKKGKEDALVTWSRTKGNAELTGPRQLLNDLLSTRMISRRILGNEPWAEIIVWKREKHQPKFFYKIEVPVREWRLPHWDIKCLKASCKVFSKGKSAGYPIPSIRIF